MPRILKTVDRKISYMLHEINTDVCSVVFTDGTTEKIDLDEISNRLKAYTKISVSYLERDANGNEYIKYTNGAGVVNIGTYSETHARVFYNSQFNVNPMLVYDNNSPEVLGAFSPRNDVEFYIKKSTSMYFQEVLDAAPATLCPFNYSVVVSKNGVAVAGCTLNKYLAANTNQTNAFNLAIPSLDYDTITINAILTTNLWRRQSNTDVGICAMDFGGAMVAPGIADLAPGVIVYNGSYKFSARMFADQYYVNLAGDILKTDASGVLSMVTAGGCVGGGGGGTTPDYNNVQYSNDANGSRLRLSINGVLTETHNVAESGYMTPVTPQAGETLTVTHDLSHCPGYVSTLQVTDLTTGNVLFSNAGAPGDLVEFSFVTINLHVYDVRATITPE